MRIAFGILAVVALVHLTGQLAGPTLLAHSTQVLLMPALAGVLLAGTTAPRGRLVHLVLVALLFSWLGDSVPRVTTGDTSFLLMRSEEHTSELQSRGQLVCRLPLERETIR